MKLHVWWETDDPKDIRIGVALILGAALVVLAVAAAVVLIVAELR